MIKALIYGCLLLGAVSSFAVSRVGGGVLWNPEIGFRSDLPPSLNRYYINSDDSIRGEGAPVFDGRSSGPQPQVLYVFMLANEQPAWKTVDNAQTFIEYYQRFGWTSYPTTDPCVIGFVKENTTSITYVLNWGLGNGIIVNTTKVTINLASAKKVVDTLVRTGACQWK